MLLDKIFNSDKKDEKPNKWQLKGIERDQERKRAFEDELCDALNSDFVKNNRQSYKLVRLFNVKNVICSNIYQPNGLSDSDFEENKRCYSFFSDRVEEILKQYISLESDETVKTYAEFVLKAGNAKVGIGAPPGKDEESNFTEIASQARREEQLFREEQHELALRQEAKKLTDPNKYAHFEKAYNELLADVPESKRTDVRKGLALDMQNNFGD